jgi:pyruvate formate lyase activating enzyme
MALQWGDLMDFQSSVKGTVLRIERTSIHDGQGLRTVVFLKGCPLRCRWCSTPESQLRQLEKGYAYHRCTRCGTCIKACPEGALSLSEKNGRIVTDLNKCKHCFICVTKCPHGALKKYGKIMTVQEVIREISKDEIFYFHSGGGVTISGGEPLEQPEFVMEILRESKRIGINTAIESSFYVSFKNIEMVLPWLDVLYVDIKHMDNSIHKQMVGFENFLILENIKKVDQSPYPLRLNIRVPIIPGINDSDQNLSLTAKYCKTLNKIKELELLPYHRLGIETYKNLGRNYPLKDLMPPSQEEILERVDFISKQNPCSTVKFGGGLGNNN